MKIANKWKKEIRQLIERCIGLYEEGERNKQRWRELKVQVDVLQDDMRRVERHTGLAAGPATLQQPSTQSYLHRTDAAIDNDSTTG